MPELTYRLLFERPLPASVLFLADLRHAVRNALVDHEEAGSAEIVMSELASNALRYGKVPSAVRLLDNERCLRVEVQDQSDQLPVLGPPLAENYQTSGRGLRLVQALCDDLGATPCKPHGKIVWARLCHSRSAQTGPP